MRHQKDRGKRRGRAFANTDDIHRLSWCRIAAPLGDALARIVSQGRTLFADRKAKRLQPMFQIAPCRFVPGPAYGARPPCQCAHVIECARARKTGRLRIGAKRLRRGGCENRQRECKRQAQRKTQPFAHYYASPAPRFGRRSASIQGKSKVAFRRPDQAAASLTKSPRFCAEPGTGSARSLPSFTTRFCSSTCTTRGVSARASSSLIIA